MSGRLADALHYHAVGYMQISPEVMHEDVASIAQQPKDIGYESTFIEGEADCTHYMKQYFGDWQAQGITSVLHSRWLRQQQLGHEWARENGDGRRRANQGQTEVTGFKRDAAGSMRQPRRLRARLPANKSSSAPAPGPSSSGTCSNCPAR